MIKGGFKEYSGKQMWFSDYGNQPEEELLQTIKDTTAFYLGQVKDFPENSVLVLIDVTGMKANKRVVDLLKESAELCKERNNKTALFGMQTIQYAILNTVAMFMPFKIKGFDTKEDAVAWLLEDDR